VSCPDWRSLAAHRDDPRTAEPASWRQALAHLDGCAVCREEAYAAEPTLVFRRLPALDRDAAAEVESMRQAVAVLRSGRRAEAGRRGAAARWRRWAAAAVFALAALSLGRGVDPENLGPVPPSSAFTSYRPATGSVPVIEGLDRPDARVYQRWDGGDMSLVFIVDESLDV
jgi:hypothetical protein